ncbi:hypothetical protein [Streptosporangium sp. NPDC087985]|uniref:hypothetical protein n=1 Tax=Streptosporangium sp. NPDC087985 TaxID=3366196 RepID=UPI0038171473
MATKNTGQRVADLESWAFRTGSDLADIKETLNDLPAIIREEVMAYTSPMFEEIMNKMATKEDLSALATSLGGRMDSMENQMTSLGGRMDSMEGRMDSIENRMTSMEGRMDSMDGKLDLILAKLS